MSNLFLKLAAHGGNRLSILHMLEKMFVIGLFSWQPKSLDLNDDMMWEIFMFDCTM